MTSTKHQEHKQVFTPQQVLECIKSGFAAIQFARSNDLVVAPKASQIVDSLQSELSHVEEEIRQCYRMLDDAERLADKSAYDESTCVEMIQSLEIKRLNLLSRMHGQNVSEYAERRSKVR